MWDTVKDVKQPDQPKAKTCAGSDDEYYLFDLKNEDTYHTELKTDILTEEFKIARSCKLCNKNDVPWEAQQYCQKCDAFFHIDCYNETVIKVGKK